jgi:hypothetical protein
VHATWPGLVETIGHTSAFDYVEFLAEYAPFDLYALDDFCRAAELYDMGTMIKVDQEPLLPVPMIVSPPKIPGGRRCGEFRLPWRCIPPQKML